MQVDCLSKHRLGPSLLDSERTNGKASTFSFIVTNLSTTEAGLHNPTSKSRSALFSVVSYLRNQA